MLERRQSGVLLLRSAGWGLPRCGWAGGAHFQITPVTSALFAPTPNGGIRERGRMPESIEQKDWFRTEPRGKCAAGEFLAGLTALLVGVLSLATHPVAAVLLILGAMAVLLYAGSELWRLLNRKDVIR